MTRTIQGMMMLLVIVSCASSPDPAPVATAADDELKCPASASASAYFKVRNSDGRNVPEAAITLRHPGGDISMHLMTSSTGTASAKCLVPARGYVIEVTKDGYRPRTFTANMFENLTMPVTVSLMPVRKEEAKP